MKECEFKLTIKMHQLEGEKCLITDGLCEENPNCYYKKLQKIDDIVTNTRCTYDGYENCVNYEIQQVLNEG